MSYELGQRLFLLNIYLILLILLEPFYFCTEMLYKLTGYYDCGVSGVPLLCLAQLLLEPSSLCQHLLVGLSASSIPCSSLALLRTHSGPLYALGEPFFFLSQPEIAASL